MKAEPPKDNKDSPRNGDAVAPKKRKADWQAVERDYRAGGFTLRELEEKHGPNSGTISRRAKKEGWTEDLSTAIKQATNAKLIAATVAQECSAAQQNATDSVLAAAEVNKNVILSHRTGLKRITTIQQKLLAQIEEAAENMPKLGDVIEMASKPDDNGVDKLRDALRKTLGRSALVDDLKKLVDVDEKVRKGEREAFGLDEEPDTGKGAGGNGGRVMTDAERAVRLVSLLSRPKPSEGEQA